LAKEEIESKRFTSRNMKATPSVAFGAKDMNLAMSSSDGDMMGRVEERNDALSNEEVVAERSSDD
jgi:hypothetical protein